MERGGLQEPSTLRYACEVIREGAGFREKSEVGRRVGSFVDGWMHSWKEGRGRGFKVVG